MNFLKNNKVAVGYWHYIGKPLQSQHPPSRLYLRSTQERNIDAICGDVGREYIPPNIFSIDVTFFSCFVYLFTLLGDCTKFFFNILLLVPGDRYFYHFQHCRFFLCSIHQGVHCLASHRCCFFSLRIAVVSSRFASPELLVVLGLALLRRNCRNTA